MFIQENLTTEKKLAILSDAAKYDVSCSSSGVERGGKAGAVGNSNASGICHSFSADGRCISLLKVLYTNECIYDCKYCINRRSNDTVRASFTPEELCELTMGFYRRNYIEGLFLSSGIKHSPNETMEELCKTLMLLREKYKFNGYIHCKTIPGADPSLVELCGWYADRVSVNLELPTAEALKELAPNKTRKAILTPLRQVQNGIADCRALTGDNGGNMGAYWHTQRKLEGKAYELPAVQATNTLQLKNDVRSDRGFVTGGQSTQMIVGASGESDYQIMAVSEALYKSFDLKRVYYSAFVRVNEDSALPVLAGGPPLLREHRLYQADWLLRYYGFSSGEILSEKLPNLDLNMDPKCNYALNHPELYPIEVMFADYFTLLKVPGIGPKSARRIVSSRKNGLLTFDSLKKMGVVMKRAGYFITCGGKRLYYGHLNKEAIRSCLLSTADELRIQTNDGCYRQLSLFEGADAVGWP